MRRIKNYEDFTNEEINFKNALAGAALGAGLSLSQPAISQNLSQDKITTEISPIQHKQLPSDIVKTSDIEVVRNMDSTVSIKLPDDFDTKQTMINASFMGTYGLAASNLKNPLGGCIFISTPKFGIYMEVKATGDYDADTFVGEMDDWVLTNTLHTAGYIYQLTDGSYYKWERDAEYYEGTYESHKIFNLGVTKPISGKNYHLRAYLGCGLSRTKVEMAEKVSTFYSEWSKYIYSSGYVSYSNPYNQYTETLRKTGVYHYENRLNISGGLIFEIPMNMYDTKVSPGMTIGIGFDTNPGSLNLMFGLSYGSRKY